MMQSEPEQLHKVPSRSNSDGDSKRGLLRRAPTFRAPERMLTQNSYTVFQERVVIAMVGLPARGKSYISKAIVRYLNFLGCPSRLFIDATPSYLSDYRAPARLAELMPAGWLPQARAPPVRRGGRRASYCTGRCEAPHLLLLGMQRAPLPLATGALPRHPARTSGA